MRHEAAARAAKIGYTGRMKAVNLFRRGLRLALLFALSAGMAGAAAAQQAANDDDLPLRELRVFADIFGKIKSDYIDSAEDAELLRDAIHGMLNGLDPHSAFLEPEEFDDMRVSTEGKFGGLGIEIVTEDGFIKVVAPIDDTPAMRAGILPGDIIVKLDGESASGLDLRDAVGKLRGAPGSSVVLTISRKGRGDFDVAAGARHHQCRQRQGRVA